jgi:hypothetical protein
MTLASHAERGCLIFACSTSIERGEELVAFLVAREPEHLVEQSVGLRFGQLIDVSEEGFDAVESVGLSAGRDEFVEGGHVIRVDWTCLERGKLERCSGGGGDVWSKNRVDRFGEHIFGSVMPVFVPDDLGPTGLEELDFVVGQTADLFVE